MIRCCLLVILLQLCKESHTVHVKSIHAILRDKLMCIETSRLMPDEDHVVLIENINVTLSLDYYRNTTMHIHLEKTDKCLSKGRMQALKETDAYFFCGIYQDTLPGTNNNLDMYTHMKVNSLKGNIDVSITNETGHSSTHILDSFDLREHVSVTLHVHGYDPCRFESKSMDVCGQKCIPLCELYATGYGLFQCSDKLKTYSKEITDLMEVSHSPFQLNAEKIHLEKTGNLVCVQVTTDIKSTCYAEFTSQSLKLYSPRNHDVKTFVTNPSCKTMFFTSNYPGTFCFQNDRMTPKNLVTYFPKSLQLFNLTMYCDDFSMVNSYREINLVGIDIQKYKMMMIYDICPHSLHEKGQLSKHVSFEMKDGLLIEKHAEKSGNHGMIALIVVCVFVFLLVVSLLLFFVFHVRKTCN